VSLSAEIILDTITIDRKNEGGLEYVMMFGVLSAVTMTIGVLMDVTAGLVEVYQHFRSTCCLH
jgi:hypothetical protein